MEFTHIPEKPIKPAEYAEQQLLAAILDNTYGPGQSLPGERVLAQALGITRPTLREALQRLAREGWVTVQHGKATLVNDYLFQGGLGVLSTLARFGQGLSPEMVSHLLEVRSLMFPGIALKAIQNDPESILAYLEQSRTLTDAPKPFVVFDWGLQMLMAKLADNPVLMMILNDFTPLCEIFGEKYFQNKDAREFSRSYYGALMAGITRKDPRIEDLVRKTLVQTEKIWRKTNGTH